MSIVGGTYDRPRGSRYPLWVGPIRTGWNPGAPGRIVGVCARVGNVGVYLAWV